MGLLLGGRGQSTACEGERQCDRSARNSEYRTKRAEQALLSYLPGSLGLQGVEPEGLKANASLPHFDSEARGASLLAALRRGW